jgi:hypothetical protein
MADKKTDESKNESDLDEVLNVIDGEPDSDKTKAKSEKKRNIILYSVFGFIIVIIAALLIIGLVFGQKTGTTEKKEQSSVTNSLSDGSSSSTSKKASYEDYLNGLGLPSYYQQSHTKISDADRKTANEAADASMPENASTALLSKASDPNLTDDQSKATLSDGTTNPEYSFLTAENVTEQVRDDMERIVNPIYGNWTGMQSKYRIGSDGNTMPSPLNSFTDMFADDRVSSVSTLDENAAKSIIPLEADWNKDDFGGKTTNSDYPWVIGVLGDLTCNYNIQSVSGDSITCSAPVTYTFVKSDGSKASEQKNLVIKYVPNYNNLSSSSRRILIDSVQQ